MWINVRGQLMMRCALVAFCSLFAVHAWGQSVTVHHESHVVTNVQSTGDRYLLTFETNPNGLTMMQVVAPGGAHCEIWDGQTLLREGDIPLSFIAEADHAYRFRVKLADGSVWEDKLSPKRQQTGSLTVIVNVNVNHGVPAKPVEDAPVVRPKTGLQGMSDKDFAALREAIEEESLPQQKWAVLQTSISSGARFWADQVGILIDLFDSSAQKVSVVEVARTRIADKKNLFQLYSHFDSEADKAKVRSMFAP